MDPRQKLLSIPLDRRSVLAALVLVLAVGGLFTAWAVQVADQELRAGLVRDARGLAHALEDALRPVALAADAAPGAAARSRLEGQLAAVLSLDPRFRSVHVLDPRGRVLAAAGSPLEGRDAGAGTRPASPPAELRAALAAGGARTLGPFRAAGESRVRALVPVHAGPAGEAPARLLLTVEAGAWPARVLAPAAMPFLLTLALVVILAATVPLLRLRARGDGIGARRGPLARRLGTLACYLEVSVVIALGLVLTAAAVWAVHVAEARHRQEIFAHLAGMQSQPVVEAFADLERIELEGLARLYESSREVGRAEFEAYAAHLERNPAVQAWEWIPAVPADEREAFEARVRAAGRPDFRIWELGPDGERVPASGRAMYYPVLRVAPRAGNEAALGFDLGSEPARRAGLERAARTGLTTGTAPLTLVQETGAQRGMLIYRPIYADGGARLRGFALAVLRLGTALTEAAELRRAQPRMVELRLLELRPDAPPATLASTNGQGAEPAAGLGHRRPVLAFGRAFALDFAPGAGFRPSSGPDPRWMTALVGLVGTTTLALLVGVLVHRRELLEREVAERTGELERTATALREASLRQEQAVRAGHVGLWDWDVETGRVVYSSEWKAQIGHAPDEVGDSFEEWRSRVHPDDLPATERAVQAAVAGERRGLRYEFRFRHKDGSWRWILAQASVLRDEDGRAMRVLGSHVDVTERRRAEEERAALQAQLLQAQKMESVGRLAGGVAHDFNNMIGVILGYVELALMRTEPGAPVRGSLEQIQKAAQRSADLTRQLLAFARKQTATPQVVSLNDVVGGMLGMLRRLIGEDIRLHWSPAGDLGPVHVDPGQVEQVLANLCVNARDAIGGAGELIIATANAEVSEARARRSEALPGSYVSLSVRDDGCGIDREVREHLFEPFFTTKGTGRGTGLGLATVYGIVKQNQGFIEVDSAPGRGSTFTILLPRHAGTSAAAGEDAAGVAGLARGMETVLLVEDEPDMLSLGRVMLSELGYRVLGAGSPERALALAERHAGELDLLVTDVVMPGMDGQELARRLRERIPGLPVLFISGYPDDVIARRGILSGEVRLLQKPFDLERLAGAVRGALDGRRAGMPGAAADGGGGR